MPQDDAEARDGALRVLIVDDSRDDAELTELALRDAGMAIDVRLVHGEAGLREALEAFAPQIVLSDVNLPGFSGAEALQITRALRPGVPVVFLTGYAELQGLELPGSLVMQKPVQADELARVLNELLRLPG